MDDFRLSFNFRDTLALYLFLQKREEELSGAAEKLQDGIRDYLYGRLSIDEMERPEALLARLDGQR